MLSELEQACKTCSTESYSGLIEFNSNWQRIFVTALTFHLDQAINTFDSSYLEVKGTLNTSRYPYFDISDL